MDSQYYKTWDDYVETNKDIINSEFESYMSKTIQSYEDLIFDFYINIVW